MRIPAAGGNPKTVVGAAGVGASHLAVNATDVYWTCIGATPTSLGGIMTAPLTGGAGTVRYSPIPGQQVRRIALGATNVFWTQDGDEVMSMPLSGGTPSTLASGSFPYEIAVTATTLYWSESTNLMAMPLTGGPPTILASLGGGELALDYVNIYWTPGGSEVVKMPLAGGTPVIIASGIHVRSIATDAMNVYWTDYNAGSVFSVSVAGGPVRQLASGQNNLGAIAVDTTSIYWIDWALAGTIMKLAK